MTVAKARDKIEAAEKLITELQKQQGYLEIRLEQEKREIQALKHELEVMHIARDLPVPKVCALGFCPTPRSLSLALCLHMCACDAHVYVRAYLLLTALGRQSRLCLPCIRNSSPAWPNSTTA